MNINDPRWKIIADNYTNERENGSLSKILIDPFIRSFFKSKHKLNILDYGAGIGTISKIMAKLGHQVDAYEPNVFMHESLVQNVFPKKQYSRINILQNLCFTSKKKFDAIICINVLDHIEKYKISLKEIYALLKNTGILILCLPHPVKDLGDWRKGSNNNDVVYLDYRIDNYFHEGICCKNRENILGSLILSDVPTYHRTISTYYNALREIGFCVTSVYEPTIMKGENKSINEEKASRVPYFIIFECIKSKKNI
jgi:2-polyprenyl-3-methyl-5-hydroxy-6-metoxy-1,4-benzoquinol methylase